MTRGPGGHRKDDVDSQAAVLRNDSVSPTTPGALPTSQKLSRCRDRASPQASCVVVSSCVLRMIKCSSVMVSPSGGFIPQGCSFRTELRMTFWFACPGSILSLCGLRQDRNKYTRVTAYTLLGRTRSLSDCCHVALTTLPCQRGRAHRHTHSLPSKCSSHRVASTTGSS